MQIEKVDYFMVVKGTIFQVVVVQDTTAVAVVVLVFHILLSLIQVVVVVHLIMDIHKLLQVQQRMERV